MQKLPDTPLDAALLAGLAAYQSRIDSLPDYAERVKTALADFERYNTKRNKTFRGVRTALASMCSGERRCMYCEDSVANVVEHYFPKAFYPERAFVWENYLYACGRCNTSKGSQFEVFSRQNGQRMKLTRSQNSPIVPPEPGDPLLIDPRTEDPTDYLLLDLTDTFLFMPRGQKGTLPYQRAQYTIQILPLNEPPLPESRRNDFEYYHSLLERYQRLREEGNTKKMLRVEEAIQGGRHRSVWAEMKRQQTRMPELQNLFAVVPESLDW